MASDSDKRNDASSDKKSVTDKKAETGVKAGDPAGSSSAEDSPEWADGLKQLYDSVVEEPLPDSFMDLLSKLDDDKE